MEPHDYGDRYYCVKTPISESGEIYVHADRVEITATGDLVFLRNRDDGGSEPNLALSVGQWKAFYGASIMDGSAVAVVHWQGEIDRG